MTRVRRCLGIGLALAMIAVSGPVAGRQQLTVSMLDALTLYEIGEQSQVTSALALARGGDADAVLRMLQQDVPKWIAADGPAEANRRRLVAATFLLEVGHAGLDLQWELTKQITEWACELLRKSGRPTEIERRWHLTAMALMEASFETPYPGHPAAPAIYRHISHIKERFPDEPRIALASALVNEYDYWTSHLRSEGMATETDPRRNESFAGGPIPALEKAAAAESNRPEAHLRIGFLEFRRGRLERALELLRSAAAGQDDETRVYLAHLFSAWTHEKAGNADLAIASYRSALNAVNGLSAALGLGVHLYARDERDEADEIVVKALGAVAETPDPFKAYGYGDFRRWPRLIASLRAETIKR